MSQFNRREFLNSAVKTFVISSAGVMIAHKGIFSDALANVMPSPLMEDITPGSAPGTLVINLSDHEELKTVGGDTVVDAGDVGKIIIAHTEENTFDALAAKCTHKGCTVAYDADDKIFQCPCHNSQFRQDGSNLSGPASSPLQKYSVTFASGVVTVWLSGKPNIGADSTNSSAAHTPTVNDTIKTDSTKRLE